MQENIFIILTAVSFFRLSRSRRTVENVFGVLSNRFRFLRTTVDGDPDRVKDYVKAACVLHNYLGVSTTPMENAQCDGPEQSDGTFFDLKTTRARHGVRAEYVRQTLCDYFNGPGAVHWQDGMV